jgi:hypothetical protein
MVLVAEGVEFDEQLIDLGGFGERLSATVPPCTVWDGRSL